MANYDLICLQHVCTLPALAYIYYNHTAAVFPPVITSTAIGDSGTPQFNITTDRFNDIYGRVAVYKVVVIRGNRVEPSDIPDSHLAPVGVSQFMYLI